MGIISFINNFKIKMANVSSYKQFSTDEVLNYLNTFPKPKDSFERSYFQYKCNSKLYGVNRFIFFLRNVGCFFPFWIFLLRNGNSKKYAHIDYVFISDEHKMDIIPEKYKSSFRQISRSEGWKLSRKERQLILKLWERYPFSYYFLLKNLIKIANYKWAISSFKPKAVLCSCEYSFTSSFLTFYCNSQNLRHINIMHGYNIIDLKCPFSTFDTMSIWDKFFIVAYKKMRCGTKRFEVEKPACIKLEKIIVDNKIPIVTYYTQNYVSKVIPVLLKLIKFLNDQGMQLIIRCHPSYPIDKADRQKFPKSTFENIDKVNIEQSLNRADFIVARNSTVLYQAAILDKKILIDDITMPEEYFESRKKGAFLWETDKTMLLSEFLKNCK